MSIEIIGSAARMPRAQEKALNLMLANKGGGHQGMPYFKVSWAADDNCGLRKKHVQGCSKTDPIDWDCSCPTEETNKVPLCFYPIQASYHLLIWSPPSAELMHYDLMLGEDTSKGIYNCILHFVDPESNQPFNPTSAIIENIIPTLGILAESMKAALAGCDAALNQQRQARIDREMERRKRQEALYNAKADALLNDLTPAFGGKPFAGAGKKRRQTSDITLTDFQ